MSNLALDYERNIKLNLCVSVLVCVWPPDREIRHRACALRDNIHAIIRDELDEDFEKICEEIKESRSTRGKYKAYLDKGHFFLT